MTAAAWSAIGTFTASGVALFIAAALPALRGSYRKPVIDIALGDTKPFEPFVRPTNALRGATLRCAIMNVGRSTAHDVQVKLSRCAYRERDTTGPVGEWTERDVDPVALHWSSMPSAEPRNGTPPVLDIVPDGREFIDLIHNHRDGKPRLMVDDLRVVGDRGWHELPYRMADFAIEITVTADDADTVTKCVGFSITMEWPYSNVAFIDFPAVAQRDGLSAFLANQTLPSGGAAPEVSAS